MDKLGVLGIICVLIYYAFTWLFPQFLSWIIKRRYHIEARIGRIGIPYFTLHDVHITKNGVSVHIDRIGFRSSFLSSEVTKLVSVIIQNVRINKDVVGRREMDTPPTRWNTPLSFHDQKIPPLVITFAQFMAVHVRSINAMLLRPESPEWLLHTTLTDLHIDGSVMHSARSLLVNVVIGSTTARLLRHAQNTSAQPRKNSARNPDACLAELSVALTAEATVFAQGPLSVQKVFIGLENTKAVMNDGFYAFARERQRPARQPAKGDESSPSPYGSTFELLYNISPIIPEFLTVKIQDAALTGSKDIAKLECLTLCTEFKPGPKKAEGYGWPKAIVDLQVNDLAVIGEREKILGLKKLSIKAELLKKLLNLRLILNTFSLVYNHLHVYSWVAENFKDLFTLKEEEHSYAVENCKQGDEDCWNQLELQGCAELYNISSVLRLSEKTGDTSVGFTRLKWIFGCEPPYLKPEEVVKSWCSPRLPIGLSERSCTTELLVEKTLSLFSHRTSRKVPSLNLERNKEE
ncbi:hypothetical protein LSTR_LSTR007171 [Laodelphax striatellus]|uniref:Uncharacterized protein n=1 Tax=Laodelphax striatellus TaxID=195883 RepID=A0A482WW14_LAOST|nr:hypothetical protein LSTR_LSTR007171 [Laodelphax striatellus]